jgi:hypothetical protein
MSDLPVLVGMNNPLTPRSDAALLPYPVGCAGWRLWRMVHDVCGVSRAEWCRRTERVNLVDAQLWDAAAGARRGEELWSRWRGRRVVVLGAAVRNALRLERSPVLLWSEREGVRWCWASHPSGLCRDYNDPMVRLVVGLRLEELIHG